MSTRAGVYLGIFEIVVFVALSAWMLISNIDNLTVQTFNPSHAPGGTYAGVFKGMVFAILAFIGFEASAPLGEEAKNPRWTVPRAVVLSCVGVGIFYVFCSYAWVIGTGFDNFTKTATAAANPWRDLGIVFWGGGWVLVFFAIINSALANSNAGATAASRVLYSLGRNGLLPKAFAKTHPTHKTPHVAIIFQTVLGLAVALLLGWKYGDLITAFSIIATAVTIVVIVVYIIVCLATVVYFSRREDHNPWLHWVLPILGAAAVRAAALLPVLPAARLSGALRELGRARLARGGLIVVALCRSVLSTTSRTSSPKYSRRGRCRRSEPSPVAGRGRLVVRA